MAKNRKGGATTAGGSRRTAALSTEDDHQKVPEEANATATKPANESAQWEIARVIIESSSSTEPSCAHTCSTEGCTAKVVAIWKKANALSETLDNDNATCYRSVCELHQVDLVEAVSGNNVQQPMTDADAMDIQHVDGSIIMPHDIKESDDDGEDEEDSDPVVPMAEGNEETNSDHDDDKEVEEEESDALWDLKKVMSIDEVAHESPIKCSHKTCKLVAAAIWVCTDKPTENWYSCLDCQENDFGGWPENIADLPIKQMTKHHKDTLIKKCSKYKEIDMPVFPESPGKGERTSILTVTPSSDSGNHDEQHDLPLKGETGDGTDKLAITAATKPPSKAQLEIHRKWQAAREEAGGAEARIVLSKPVAKQIIFDYLHDSFRPMNITEIHKGLKAVIPSPILKACLDDMALDTDASTQFADSDDEDEEPKKKLPKPKNENPDPIPYKNSLSFKAGKGSNSSLYYVNYNTTKDGGGFDRERKNQLTSEIVCAEAEESVLKNTLLSMNMTKEKLLSEPKNEELVRRLDSEEAELVDLVSKVTAARKLAVNEEQKATTKKRIEHYASVWRKRRRLCMDFLFTMEEATEGQVNSKKCLLGDGQIDCESDELVAKQAIDFAKSKRHKLGPKKLGSSRANNNSKSGIQASESFVAMLLDSKGDLKRVHFDSKDGERFE